MTTVQNVRSLALGLVCSLIGCTGVVGADLSVDAQVGFDAGLHDAGSAIDSGAPKDGGSLVDAGAPSDAGALADAGDPVGDAGQTSPVDGGGSAADAGPAPGDAGGTFTPDAGSRPDGGIINPYYTYPGWKLWALDASVVHYTGFNLGDPVMKSGDFTVTPEATRAYPDPSVNTYPVPFLKLQTPGSQPAIAGSWDDAYATRDGAHTVIGTFWSDSNGNGINLGGQFVRVPFGQCQPVDLARLGINYTSESFASSGHQFIDQQYVVTYTEQYFSFANTVRGTPAYLSYAETIADRGIDSYDALYSHAFNSVGRSGSETGALFKMLTAGAFMPRATKDLLKLNGAYAMVMINLFRQTLPYAEVDGTSVSRANEMLQRPAYFSNGTNVSQEFVPRNASYHQYDESLHLYRMIQAARAMVVAPPIAIIKIVGITVTKAGATLVDNAATDARIHSANKTMARIWGNTGETIALRVDVGGSYDLQARALSAGFDTVYPEQKNISIVREGGTVWRITVSHNAALPKGRIPVALFVNNGVLDSPPAFINFYWAEPGQVDTPPYVSATSPVSTSEVQKNLRPLLSTSLTDDWVNVKPGATAAFDLSCTDPEGFSVRFYRWLNEVGTLAGTHFGYTAPATDPGLVHPVHLICADGTGGYESTLVRVAVTPNDGPLPPPWQSTVYGLPEASGSVNYDGGFEVVGNGRDVGYYSSFDEGRIVFQERTGDVELTAQVLAFTVDGSTASSTAKGGVMIRESLSTLDKEVFAYVQGNQNSAAPLTLGANMRPAKTAYLGNKAGDSSFATAPTYLKAVRRGALMVGLGSGDGVTWEQLWAGIASTPTAKVYAGLAVLSADPTRLDAVVSARGRFKVLADPVVSIPVASLAGTVTANTYSYAAKVTVTLVPGVNTDAIRYTLDGSDPTVGSPLYSAAFDVTTQGDTVMKAKSFAGANASGTTVLKLTVTP